MKRICMMLIVLILLLSPCMASDSGEIGDFGGSSAADLLPDEAEKQLEDWHSLDAASAGQRAKSLIAKAFSSSEGKLRQALGLCVSMFGVVLLSSVLRTMAQGDSMGALELAGVLGISMLAYGQISGFFTQMTSTVDQMAVFSGGLFPALASATAAMGKLGSSTALYAVTTAVCGLMSRGLELVFLPGIDHLPLGAERLAGAGHAQIEPISVEQLPAVGEDRSGSWRWRSARSRARFCAGFPGP